MGIVVLSACLIVYFSLLPFSETCIPTQDAAVDPPGSVAANEAAVAAAAAAQKADAAAATTTVPPECQVCGSIYENGGCVADPGGYGGTPTCPPVTVTYTRGALADGYGNADTCSIDIACPSGSDPVYVYSDDSQTMGTGNLVATCSETVGTWYQQETTMVVKNVFCRDP